MYKSKEVEVQAIQFFDDKIDKVKEFCGDCIFYDDLWEFYVIDNNPKSLNPLGGTGVFDEDYIIKMNNKFFVIGKELFNNLFTVKKINKEEKMDYIERMEVELSNLRVKAKKLKTFREKELKEKKLTTEEERHLLGMQLYFMNAYMEILEHRLEIAKNK